MEYKKEVIEWILTEGSNVPTRAAKKFKLPPGTVRSWWASRDDMLNATNADLKRSRKRGAGCSGTMVEYDEEIAELILNLRNAKERVTRDIVRNLALDISKREGIVDFQASDGWLTKFMERNRFSFRRVTNLCALSDEKLLDRAFEYMKFLQTMRARTVPRATILMDETAVYLEDPRRTTIDSVGSKHVLLNTTGFASMRITVVLAVKADGSKVPPLVILKGKETAIERKHGIWVVYQSKAWVNQDLLKNWLDLVYPSVLANQGKFIVWDSCRAHIAKRLKGYMKTRGILSVVIPGGLTAYVQAGDIGMYKSFKDKLSPLISEWKASGTVELTRGGNPKPPREDIVCFWVKTAWRSVEKAVVEKSIVRAGFHDDYAEWHISRHDVFGERFRSIWVSNSSEHVDEFDLEEEEVDDPFMIDES